MKIFHLAILAISAILFIAGPIIIMSLSEDEGEVDLSSVPDVVLDAVKEAKPDATITGAEFEVEQGVEMYEITAVEGDIEYEFDVTPEGEILDMIIDDDTDDERLMAAGWVFFGVGAMGIFFIAHVVSKQRKNRQKEGESQQEIVGVKEGVSAL